MARKWKLAAPFISSQLIKGDSVTCVHREETPATLDFKVMEGSMYNTPPCWAIYMCGLVFNHMLRNGGIEAMKKTNDAKAKILYDAIDKSDGFYVNPIAPANRSNMNVPFTIPMSQELEAVFVKEAAAAGMVSTLLWQPSCSRPCTHVLLALFACSSLCCSQHTIDPVWQMSLQQASPQTFSHFKV